MITPVSFGSTYKLKTLGLTTKGEINFRKFRDFACSLNLHHQETDLVMTGGLKKKYPYYYKGEVILTVPDEMDELIDKNLEFHNIKCKKIENKQA